MFIHNYPSNIKLSSTVVLRNHIEVQIKKINDWELRRCSHLAVAKLTRSDGRSQSPKSLTVMLPDSSSSGGVFIHRWQT
jgi:hypothetical protein